MTTAVMRHFGLDVDPFQDPLTFGGFYRGEQYVRALTLMGRVLWSRYSLGVITGERGTGKSLLARVLSAELDDRVLVAHASAPQSDPRQFLGAVLRQLGFPEPDPMDRNLRRTLHTYLTHQESNGRVCLLIVEDAASLGPHVLDELRELIALEAGGRRVLKVLLLGSAMLRNVISSPRLAPLLEDSLLCDELPPLSALQTHAYLDCLFGAAGALSRRQILPDDVVRLAYDCSGGIPSRLNAICRLALQRAEALQMPEVSPVALFAAASSLGFEAASSLPDLAPSANLHRPRLESLDGDPDKQWTLGERPLIFGRQAEGVVPLASVVVSRHHALVIADGAGVWLMDLHSTNGTRVNGHRVERCLLHEGDRLTIGPLQLVFREAREPIATHDVEATLSMVPRSVRDAG